MQYDTILDNSSGLPQIDDNYHITAGVQIYTHDTVNIVVKNGELEKENKEIGNNIIHLDKCRMK